MPRSSKQIQEDTDYTLFSVSLFRRIADTFKAEARQRGFQVCVTFCCLHLICQQQRASIFAAHDGMTQVREYEFDAQMQDLQEKSATKLKTDVETKRSQLEQWSSTAYGEV